MRKPDLTEGSDMWKLVSKTSKIFFVFGKIIFLFTFFKYHDE